MGKGHLSHTDSIDVGESLGEIMGLKGNIWLVLSSIGLGFCIAATESERYTALWNFNTRSLPELAIITLFLLLGICLIARFGKKRRLYHQVPLLCFLGLISEMGLAIRTYSLTVPISNTLSLAAAVMIQAASFLILIFAEFHLETGVKKSMASLAVGLMISGVFQTLIVSLPRILGCILVLLYIPIALTLLVVADRLRTSEIIEREMEDRVIEGETKRMRLGRKGFIGYCLSLLFLDILLIALHDSGMAYQDGGVASLQIELASGIGTAIGGFFIYAALRYLHEFEVLEFTRILILPLVMAALYLTTLFGGDSVFLYFIPLGICYSILLLFIWTVPRQMKDDSSHFLYLCLAYLSYRIGWALGILTIMIIPGMYHVDTNGLVILVSFAVLLALGSIQLVSVLRNRGRDSAAERPQPVIVDVDEAFVEACATVSKRYALSPRESEVLPLLAKGRNALYIAKALFISDGTARTHIMHIYHKMGINSQQSLMDEVDGAIERKVGRIS